MPTGTTRLPRPRVGSSSARSGSGSSPAGSSCSTGRDPKQGQALAEWLTALIDDFSDDILPVTVQVAATWGRLGARGPLPTGDGLIAATALVHDLTLVARNVDDYEGAGVRLLNPFSP